MIYVYLFVICIFSSKGIKLAMSSKLPFPTPSRNFGGASAEKRFDVIDVAKIFGYEASAQYVTTIDEFLLTLHRIPPHISSKNKKKYPVLLISGLLCDANFFFVPNSEKNLPFLLSSKGYDVWIGNVRGTYYSEKSLENGSKNSSNFWNFSIDEMAKYDIPAFINYILNISQSEKIFYIGHSQGSMILFGAISNDQSINEKIKCFIALGPAARLGNAKGVLSQVTRFKTYFEACTEDVGSCHIFIKKIKDLYFLVSLCKYLPYYFCSLSLMAMTGWNHDDMNEKILMCLINHVASPTSSKNIVHYIQLLNSKKFAAYDYGPEQNMIRYGTENSPEYNISKVSVPVYLFSGQKDILTPPEDVKWIHQQLKDSYLLRYEKIAHLDYVVGKISSPEIFKKIITIFDGFSDSNIDI